MSIPENDPLCIVFMPALVALLCSAEHQKGEPLTEAEVMAIRDNATCIKLPFSVAAGTEKERGYPDIVAENAWSEWQVMRRQLFS